MPKLSVIMPVYNGEKYITEAIESILMQTFRDFEFIIIDDGSTDSSAEIIRRYNDPRIRFVRNKRNMGVATTLNCGIELTTGKYIARMDADDISMPNRFLEQIEYMDTHPNIAVCGTDVEFIGEKNGIHRISRSSEQLKIDLLFASCFAHPSVMMRGSVLRKENLRYDPLFENVEDYDLWDRISVVHALGCVPLTLLKYRIHPNQVTQNYTGKLEGLTSALRMRQMERLGLGSETASLIDKYINSADLSSVNDLIEYLLCFAQIESSNRSNKVYDAQLLHNALDCLKTNALAHYPISTALRICKASGYSPFGYALLRVYRSTIAFIYNKRNALKCKFKLKRRKFTIVSNNCWGGFVYQKYSLKYYTPTIGLYIPGDDFVKLCSDLNGYLRKELKFISWETARLYPQLQGKQPYPIAKLGDIEIYFMHYSTEEEARKKWERRKNRIDPHRTIFKLSQRECCSSEDIKNFLSLPHSYKICFAYDSVPGATVVPELLHLVGEEWTYTKKYFDELEYLNGIK